MRGQARWSPVLVQRAVSEGWEGSSQTLLLARRGRTIRMCSLDARSEGQSGHSPQGKVEKIGRYSPVVVFDSFLDRLHNSILNKCWIISRLASYWVTQVTV
jgi:hypothetical protein